MSDSQPKRHVLYVTYFYLERSLRPRGVVPLLPRYGIRPVVLCAAVAEGKEAPPPTSAAPDDPVFLSVSEPLRGPIRSAYRGGLQARALLRRLLRPIGSRGSLPEAAEPEAFVPASTWSLAEEVLAFPDRHAPWIPVAILRGARAARRYSCRAIYASALPASDLFVGYFLSKLLRLPLVCEFRDPWVDYYFAGYRTRFRRALDRSWERRILHHARRIVVVTEPMRRQFLAAHPDLPEDSVRVIPNGLDPSHDWDGTDASREGRRVPGSICPRVLAYVGHLYARRNPATLFTILGKLREEHAGTTPLKLRFVGQVDSRYLPLVGRQVEAGLAEICGVRPVKESYEEMRRADILLLLQENGPGAEGIMTGKIFPYLASGRPILAVVPAGGVAAQLIRETGAGVVADPDRPEEIEAAIRGLLRGDHTMPDLARTRDILRRFGWPVLAGEIAQVLHQVMAAAGAEKAQPCPR